MANNNENGAGGIGKIILVIIGVLFIFSLFGSCSDSCSSGGRSKYEEDLDSGLDKFYRGEKMNEDEYKAVKDYNEWQNKQGEKTYNDWND